MATNSPGLLLTRAQLTSTDGGNTCCYCWHFTSTDLFTSTDGGILGNDTGSTSACCIAAKTPKACC